MIDNNTTHHPNTWMQITGIRLSEVGLGWRNEEEWNLAINRDEFLERATKCSHSARRWPVPLWDERQEPSDYFVGKLSAALQTELGVVFGLGIEAEEETWMKVARGIALKMGVGEGEIGGNEIYLVTMNTEVKD